MANFFTKIISKLVGTKKTLPIGNNTQIVNFDAFPASQDEDKNLNSTYSACVNFYGGVISKLSPILSRNFKEVRDYPNLKYLLEFQPNRIQTSANFMKQIAVSYFSLNIAVIYIERDWRGETPDKQIKNLWLIDVTDTNFQVCSRQISVDQNEIFFSFMLNGKTMTANLNELIILTRSPSVQNPYFNENDPIKRTIQIINQNYHGIEKAILNANVIRFLATSPTILDESKAVARQTILNDRLKHVTANGALYVDGAQTITPIPSTPSYQGSELVKPLNESVYEYFGLNAQIINGSCTDDQLNNLIETQIEPMTHEFEVELTVKLLAREAIAKGLRIVVDTSRLFTTSHQHRIQSAQVLIASGKFKPNEIRKLVGIELLPESDDGFINRIDRIGTDGGNGTQPNADDESTGKENNNNAN